MVVLRSLLFGVVSCLPFLSSALPSISRRITSEIFVSKSSCNSQEFTYQELAGYGSLPSNFRDKYGDTVSFGSSIAIERKGWAKNGSTYTGILWMLPDRGWNTEGTTNYQPRIHKFGITLTTTGTYPSPANLAFAYKDTVLFTDPSGAPLSGLDSTTTMSFQNHPDLPAAKYTGNGFGGEGEGGMRVSFDPEGLVLDTVSAGGGFWISDEYGPFIYHFDKNGKTTQVIKSPEAFIPIRNSVESFSSANPPLYDPDQVPAPEDPTSGRANNQGIEGLSVSADGKTLYALVQSALVQDGGLEKYTNRYTRFLTYDISNPSKPIFTRENVVPLPQYNDPSKKPSKNPRTASQSEIFAISSTQFLILARDTNGEGSDNTTSAYRQIDVFDISKATNIKGPKYDSQGAAVAPVGVLDAGVTPAKYCSFLSFNNQAELAKFGLSNGGDTGLTPLNAKWEGLAVAPVDGKNGADNQWFVIAVNDNDFITQDGAYNFGKNKYQDASGLNLDSQALVFKIQLPPDSTPFGPRK